MKNFPFQRLWIVGITLSLSAADPDCSKLPDNPNCLTTTSRQTYTTSLLSTSSTTNTTTADKIDNSTTTTTLQTDTNDSTTKPTVQITNTTILGTTTNSSSTTSSGVSVNQTTAGNTDSSTTVIVAASVGTCVAVIFFLLFFLIRRRYVLKNCNLPHKKPEDKKSTSFSNNMYPDIAGTSDDNKYAEIPFDNLDSIKTEDNVYQTIDPLQEQETVIVDKYSHISGNAWPLTNASYSHIASDFQSKRVVPDYTHIEKLEGNPKGDLRLKTKESNTSYDIIGKTKFGVTENPQMMEPTYNHIRSETNHTGTSTSDVNNYSHLHVLNKTTQINETMTNYRYNKQDNPNLVHKEEDLCLKEGDTEPKSIDKTEEKEPPAVVKLPEASKFSLTANCEENPVDHQYFVLEKVDKTEEKEPPAVVKLPEASHFSLKL